MATDSPVTPLRDLVDRLLREQRPDRYTDTEWTNAVVDAIPRSAIPDDEIRRFALEQFVRRREAQATRRANTLLRTIGETGQLVLDWWEQANEPIAIETEIVDEHGNKRRIKERVALRAATPEDFRAFSRTERERADKDHKTRYITCDGADFLAAAMTEARQRTFTQWAETQIPPTS
jgi:hypothetical protein